MAEFRAFAAGAKVDGQVILSVLKVLEGFRNTAMRILREKGIDNPRPGKLYCQQAWLDAFKIISDRVGSLCLVQVGRMIHEANFLRTDIDSLEKALVSVDEVYRKTHDNDKSGKYMFIRMGLNSARVICRTPYPCDLDKGIIQSMSWRYKPVGTLGAVVFHDGPGCRKNGDDECVYMVRW